MEYSKKQFLEMEGLPLGRPDERGKLHRRFALRSWGWEEEEAVGKLRENPNITMGRLASEILARLITVWGDINFAEIDIPERILHLCGSFLGDVMYAYFALRIDALGPDMTVEPTCPFCKTQFKWTGDLNSADVLCTDAEDVSGLYHQINFPRPILLGKNEVNWIKLRPMRWEIMHTMPGGASGDSPLIKKRIFQDAIVEAEGIESHGGLVIVDERLKTLRKLEIEIISDEIDRHQGGPYLRTKIQCPSCKQESYMLTDWSYDNFFGVSSLSLR